ncbi:MAG TPA: phosphatase PAP2 family protein [Candidatus Saccharimonadales bacterium]|nr:phosphatase PAP2 family protein [Candidatus Saccharimonadales bacterium]
MHAIVIVVAKYFIVIPVIGVLWVLVTAPREQRLKLVGQLLLGAFLTVLFAKAGSYLYHDPRPFVVGHSTPYFPHSPDNGFPSDHTLLAAFLAYWVYLYRRNVGILLCVVALLIGAARVVAGVHHPMDILGSLVFACLGLASACVITRLVWKSADTKDN